MKIIEQYIYAIGQKLPMRGRSDVKKELKSLLLDEIEAKYGPEPTEKQVYQAISDFGAPSKVAKRYSGTKLVIGPGFTDIYFLVFKILIFAMTVAFTTIFFVHLFTENLSGVAVLKEIGQVVLNVWKTSLSGIGMLTIIFIIISRFRRESEIDLEENWSPKELKGIPLGDENESRFENYFGMFFIFLLLVIINFFPQLLSLAESSFEKSGMLLGNKIDLDRFALYAAMISLVWIGEIVYHILALKIAVKTDALQRYRTLLSLAAIIVLLLMVLDPDLFTINPDATLPALIGFKTIFLIVLAVSAIELVVKTARSLINRVAAARENAS